MAAGIDAAHVAEAGAVAEAMGEPVAELAPVAFVGVDGARAGVALVREVVAPAGEGRVEVAGEGQLTALVHGFSRSVEARCVSLHSSARLVRLRKG